MREPKHYGLWVVYLMNFYNNKGGKNAVCQQSEWDAMELARPGHHTLIRSGIATEGEAEQVARGTSGDPPVRAKRGRDTIPPFLPTPVSPNQNSSPATSPS